MVWSMTNASAKMRRCSSELSGYGLGAGTLLSSLSHRPRVFTDIFYDHVLYGIRYEQSVQWSFAVYMSVDA